MSGLGKNKIGSCRVSCPSLRRPGPKIKTPPGLVYFVRQAHQCKVWGFWRGFFSPWSDIYMNDEWMPSWVQTRILVTKSDCDLRRFHGYVLYYFIIYSVLKFNLYYFLIKIFDLFFSLSPISRNPGYQKVNFV